MDPGNQGHQSFHPFHFGPRPFPFHSAIDPQRTDSIPFKLSALLYFLPNPADLVSPSFPVVIVPLPSSLTGSERLLFAPTTPSGVLVTLPLSPPLSLPPPSRQKMGAIMGVLWRLEPCLN
ncbi:unnamed protein product [Nezara viridula]|uniref:Uncharacterized protein n=1 Tax=Nezara viridula TaxID=85310 RepID=A0A9P0MY24_NEZVI|nr:unnamed protein product [Nezara viridula]